MLSDRGSNLTCRLLTVLLLFLIAAPLLIGPWASAIPPAPAAETETPESVTPSPDKLALERVKGLLDGGQADEAIAALESFLSAYTESDYLDEAYVLMARALVSKKKYADAVSHLRLLLQEFPTSPQNVRARLLLGKAQFELGNLDAALTTLGEAKSLATTPDLKLEAISLIRDVQVKRGDLFRALQSALEELPLAPEEQHGLLRAEISSLVSRMDRRTLRRVQEAYPTSFPGDIALIRGIEQHTTHGEEQLAERELQLFVKRFPAHAYAATATETLRTIKAKLKAYPHLLAALVPLSGRATAYGTEVLNGVRLALDKMKDQAGHPSVGLLVKDSETLSRAELSETLAEYRPVAVIGPLFSREVQMLAGLSEQAEIPFITPTATLSDLRRLGANLFSTALSYAQQARRIAEYATGSLKLRRFCVLHPDNAYGQELTRLFIQEIKQRGGEIIAVESYKDAETDFGPQIRRIKAEDLKHHGTSVAVKTSKGGTRLEYTPGFDAMFLPGDYARVALIAPQLVFYDMKVSLLGSNGWNTPDLTRLPERWLNDGVFVDAFFVESPEAAIREFVDQYRRRYQAAPSLIAAQAYDAARVALEAVRSGAGTGKAVREQLAKRQDLPTLGGPAAFSAAGTLNRRVYVIQIKNGKLIQVN